MLILHINIPHSLINKMQTIHKKQFNPYFSLNVQPKVHGSESVSVGCEPLLLLQIMWRHFHVE